MSSSNPIDELAIKEGEFKVRKWCKDFLKKKGTSGVLPAKREEFKPEDIAARYFMQKGRCNECGDEISIERGKPGGFEPDHIMPVAKGGLTKASNLQLLCTGCNREKGAEHPSDTAKRTNTTLLEMHKGKASLEG